MGINKHKNILLACSLTCALLGTAAADSKNGASTPTDQQDQPIKPLKKGEGWVTTPVTAQQINPTTVEVVLPDANRLTLDFYGDNIFRLFRDDEGGIIRNPEAKPEAQILVDQPRRQLSSPLELKDEKDKVSIISDAICISFDKKTGLFSVENLKTGKILRQAEPIYFERGKSHLDLKTDKEAYFYGGGVQNGRFSHKGKKISIENQNSWTDGGVASPTPFYWSTEGYGILWHTFKKGAYDFSGSEQEIVRLQHDEKYLDTFLMFNDGPINLLKDLYQLTGEPVLLPRFAFYQGHLNAYNRDYWKEDEKGILFEDGKRYKESQTDNGGIRESLNGENNNYQFSARAVIDRYKKHDMPLGWLLPNDGYGAGYGQTGSLDGNIANLKALADYARANGVEIGLWTQSDLHPKDGVEPLLQRDIVKEVRDAGVRVLKTDVAWVGTGYSFGLNGIADVAQIMPYYGNNARPFIISLDGWAGTQRYAGIWSGDQTGGEWEYIRFHIPTYIGSGLSGQPNISSDMDGIFGGKNPIVNTRDFQWKTFTPMELNMDGWGSNEKYAHALGEPGTSINRWYLKLKSELMPYTYTIAEEAVSGKPMIRAMFLDDPNPYTLGKDTQYQFMYGPNFLVAPVYRATKSDAEGNDIRHGIYLPKGQWIDYFTGDLYEGGKIYNYVDAPLWKLPVFVKNGAIIPMSNPSNNVSEIDQSLRIVDIYPHGESSFTLYDDDGTTEEYRLGKFARTPITSSQKDDKVTVRIGKTEGDFTGFVKNKRTELRLNVTQKPTKLSARIGDNKTELKEAATADEFRKGENVYFYDAAPNLNRFATPGSPFAEKKIVKNPQVLVKLAEVDTTQTPVEVVMEGFAFAPEQKLLSKTGTLTAPKNAVVTEDNAGPHSLKPTWESVGNADFYEVMFNDMLYTTIKEPEFLFEELTPETAYNFRVRAVNSSGQSPWTSFTANTKSNPLEFAIPGIAAECSVESHGASLPKFFDQLEKDVWHTKHGEKAVPFHLILDLQTVNSLDKICYVPRADGGNGTFLQGRVFISPDKDSWTEVGSFDWKKDADEKTFSFKDAPKARFIKIEVDKAVGDYGSGRELYVFKVPGTESWLPGDINNDGKIDRNDLTSYINYTGLKKGDNDFEGYICNGDINGNGLIDAYDISVVGVELVDDDAPAPTEEEAELPAIEGSLELIPDKKSLKAGETVNITVKGKDLKSVNALSFALPYSQDTFEYVGLERKNVGSMENMTNDRLHTDGSKVLYPTFVNVGSRQKLNGSEELFVLKFKAKKKTDVNFQPQHGMLVDKKLKTIKF